MMASTSEAAHSAPVKSALVVDDHPLYCDALASMMESVFHIRKVRKAASLEEAMEVLRDRFSPDIVMLDLNLPDVSGLSGFMKIKDRAQDVPVVVISAITSADVVQSVMAAGAAGFIPKDLGRDRLKAAMLDISDGKAFVPPGYSEKAPRQPEDTSITDISRRIAALSQQQGRILALICKGKPNKLIAYEMDLAEATVKAHITTLLRRLGVRNRTQAALLVREVSIRHNLQ
ncbi:MAG: response regulator transcription factor [Albidovulum sp.]|uniref:response regulator n=1 Tax=Albidovulum sp. TaxID=1872424 RepID=UPI003C97CB97